MAAKTKPQEDVDTNLVPKILPIVLQWYRNPPKCLCGRVAYCCMEIGSMQFHFCEPCTQSIKYQVNRFS